MTRRKLLVSLSLGALVVAARPAQAIICENCSTIAQQLMDYAKQAQSYLTQLQQLQNEVMMYATMVRNTITLPQMEFAQLQGTVGQIAGLANVSSLLTGNSGSMLTRLTTAGSYGSSFSGALYNVENIGNQYDVWQNTLGDGLKKLAGVLGLQQTDLSDNAAIAEAAQTHLQTAGGQMQAIQAAGELAAANNTVLNQIAQTNIAYAQAYTRQQAVDNDRRAAEDAELLRFSQFNALPDTGNQGF